MARWLKRSHCRQTWRAVKAGQELGAPRLTGAEARIEKCVRFAENPWRAAYGVRRHPLGWEAYRVSPGTPSGSRSLDVDPGGAAQSPRCSSHRPDGAVQVGKPALDGCPRRRRDRPSRERRQIPRLQKKRRKNYRRRQGHDSSRTACASPASRSARRPRRRKRV